MDLVIVPLILVVLGVLAWTWWAARAGRDPVSSVDSFNRALSAMQPVPTVADPVTSPADPEPPSTDLDPTAD